MEHTWQKTKESLACRLLRPCIFLLRHNIVEDIWEQYAWSSRPSFSPHSSPYVATCNYLLSYTALAALHFIYFSSIILGDYIVIIHSSIMFLKSSVLYFGSSVFFYCLLIVRSPPNIWKSLVRWTHKFLTNFLISCCYQMFDCLQTYSTSL